MSILLVWCLFAGMSFVTTFIVTMALSKDSTIDALFMDLIKSVITGILVGSVFFWYLIS